MQQGSYARTLDAPRSIIAVFDDWLDLQVVLEPMSAQNGCGFCVVIHARKEAHPDLSSAVEENIRLTFKRTKPCAACTGGPFADALTAGMAQGRLTLAEMFRRWMSVDQASQLQDHVERGRLLLWAQPATTEQFGDVCGHLVRASPHLVEICKMDLQVDAAFRPVRLRFTRRPSASRRFYQRPG